MTIEIKHVDGRILFTSTTAADVKTALKEAIAAGSDLRGSNLSYSDLRGSDLRGSDLSYSDLSGSDLRYSDLSGSDLSGSDLSGSDLSGLDLSDARAADLIIARTRILPDEGAVIGWKKVTGNNIAKLLIPFGVKRSHAMGRKCRAAEAQVLEIVNIETGESVAEAFSLARKDFKYTVGETVRPTELFDEDWTVECTSGIHFYITRAEAVAHA